MKIRVFQPSAILSEYVYSFLYVKENCSSLSCKIIPGGYSCMVFMLNGDPNEINIFNQTKKVSSQRIILGQVTESYQLTVGNKPEGIIALFKPTALSRMFSLPFYQLTNNDLSLDDLIGVEAEHIHDQIYCAKNIEAKIAVLEMFLLKMLKKIKKNHEVIDKVVNFINEQKGRTIRSNIYQDFDISLRNFQRKFKESVGLSSKQYARIIRLNYIINIINESSQNLNWQDILHLGGYYDQMHFIKDFKSFTGLSPSLYFKDSPMTLFNPFSA
ncbi:MAG: AraC family transcriptional regulator [Bacteroidales bacterium]|jgi:AraC-like DNA-binding protein|nr:AraC family transcriptional regulator [Bacteroidales bacterium]